MCKGHRKKVQKNQRTLHGTIFFFFIGNLKAKDGDCSNAYTQENYVYRQLS